MKNSCSIIPQKKDKNGTIKDSTLFKELLSYTNDRKTTVDTYLRVVHPDFVTRYYPDLKLNAQGEPTLKSLLGKFSLPKRIPEEEALENLNKSIGAYEKGTIKLKVWNVDSETIHNITKKANDFNSMFSMSEDYIAVVKKVETNGIITGYTLSIEKGTPQNHKLANQMQENEALNDQLRSILTSLGVSIGVLTELEERLGVNGVTDFEQAKKAAQGMVELIRLARGERGEQALPEEFAHFAVEALGEHPLVNRLLNTLKSNNKVIEEILGDEYENYYKLYKGDVGLLAKEAAGKLVAKHLINKEKIPTTQYKTILERVIDAIKEFFSSWKIKQFQQALKIVEEESGKIAKGILDKSLVEKMSLKNIKDSNVLYQTAKEKANRDLDLIRSLLETELKKLNMYSEGNVIETAIDIRKRINALQQTIIKGNYQDGIVSYVENALEELKKIQETLTYINTAQLSDRDKAKKLREIYNYLQGYKNTIKELQKIAENVAETDPNRTDNKIKVLLDNLVVYTTSSETRLKIIASPLFANFLRKIMGNKLEIKLGKKKGETITPEDLIKFADKDISFFDRWLNSAADSTDYVIKILDQAVKSAKGKARLAAIEDMKELQAAHAALEKAGYHSTEWMFEKDKHGKRTGRYISSIDYVRYNKELSEERNRLKALYKDDKEAYTKALKSWISAHTQTVNGQQVPIYKTDAYERLSAAQKQYYNTVIKMKVKLDAMLPAGTTTTLQTIKIRKDYIERLKKGNVIKQTIQSAKDSLLRRSDDTEFGIILKDTDLAGNPLEKLPIYYITMRAGETEEDISTDVTGTMIAYAAMAQDYKSMNEIIDQLEIGRILLQDRKIGEQSGDNAMTDRKKGLISLFNTKIFKSVQSSNFLKRLNDYFSMQVYGRYMADEGTLFGTKIDQAKAANNVNRITALNTLALNMLAGISNVTTGNVMMKIESFCREFFTESDTLKADRIYASQLPGVIGEVGKRVKTSKLALWDELFNVFQDYEETSTSANFDRRTRASQLASENSLYLMNNIGEHWMQNRTSLALANQYKLVDKNGKEISLWDAYEVVYTDPNNHDAGARLVLKEGVKKKDGTEFTEDDVIAFSRKSAAINQRMHGIYNNIDKNAIQRLGIGRMAILYRKWIVPAINRRFQVATYNFDMQAWTEGYYRSLGHFLNQMVKDLRHGQLHTSLLWEQLTSTEKANIKRSITEISIFLLLAITIALLESGGDDDDKDRTWASYMLEYQIRRLYTEIGAFVPSPFMLNEGFKILKSPAAGISTMEGISNLVGLINPYNYETFAGEDALIQSGRYEGKSRAAKLFWESPVVPMNRTVYRWLHPKESIPYFKQ